MHKIYETQDMNICLNKIKSYNVNYNASGSGARHIINILHEIKIESRIVQAF